MSTMMVTSELNLGHSMANIEVESKRGQMKIFLKSVKEYMKTKSEQLGMQINRLLQVLSVTIDLSIFDPNNSTVSEFLVCLHELMMGIEQRSSIAWNCVEVLCNVCKNSAARTAIIHTYQFLGPLSRLLGDHLPYERKLKLLKLLQDVTCGIKISWLVPQLPPLMFMLTKWIDTERGDEQLVNVCLGIIVNICYKNLPGVYTLSRYVDLKKLMKTCMNLRGPKVEVHICKLLIILDYNSGNVPEEALLKLIEVTFKNIIEAFKAFDAVLLRHIVEFFLDVLKENQNSEIMASYAHYYSQVQNLLEVLESNFGASEGGDAASRDPECMALIFQFLLAIIQIKFFELHAFYSRILHLVLQWLQTDVTCAPALLVLQTIVVNSVKHEIVNLSPIGPSIPMLLTTFNLGTEGILADIEQQKIMGALLQLLRALLEANYLRERLLIDIRVEMVEKMFVPFLTETNKAMDEEEAGCSVDAINLFVYSVALVEELQKHDEQWKKLYAELMDQKQVHILLAQALYRCPKDVKRTILKMTTSPTFPLDAVTDALTELQHIMDDPSAKNEKQMARSNVYIPVISVAKIEMVDSVISELKQAISENNLISVSTSHVMELYEYKIAAMSHSERVSMASIEAASQRCMHLQHRVAQLSTELNRLHQLFIGTQQNYEVATKKVEEMTESMKDIEEKYTVEREKYKECKSKLQVKEQSVAKLQVLTEELDRKNAELAKEKLAADEQNIAYKKVIVKLEENIQRKEKIDERNKESLKQANAGIEILRKQKAELESKLLTKENELAAALQNLKRTREELEEKRRVMETITRMVSSQKT